MLRAAKGIDGLPDRMTCRLPPRSGGQLAPSCARFDGPFLQDSPSGPTALPVGPEGPSYTSIGRTARMFESHEMAHAAAFSAIERADPEIFPFFLNSLLTFKTKCL